TFGLGKGVVVSASATQTGGTATSGSDYTAFGTQTATFNGGASDGTVTTGATVNSTLAVTQDRLLEGNETVLLTLASLSAGGTATSLGNTANTTTITDDESATLSIGTSDTVTEAGGAQ